MALEGLPEALFEPRAHQLFAPALDEEDARPAEARPGEPASEDLLASPRCLHEAVQLWTRDLVEAAQRCVRLHHLLAQDIRSSLQEPLPRDSGSPDLCDDMRSSARVDGIELIHAAAQGLHRDLRETESLRLRAPQDLEGEVALLDSSIELARRELSPHACVCDQDAQPL